MGKLQHKHSNKRGLLTSFLEERRYSRALAWVPKEAKILDLGCGNGRFMEKILHYQQYTGVDIFSPKKKVNDKTKFIKYNLEIGFPTELSGQKFNSIICLALIEHLNDPVTFLSRAKNFLAKNGNIIITTPHPIGFMAHNLGSRLGIFSLEAAHDHKQFLNRNDLSKSAEKAGLKIYHYERFLFSFNQLIIMRK